MIVFLQKANFNPKCLEQLFTSTNFILPFLFRMEISCDIHGIYLQKIGYNNVCKCIRRGYFHTTIAHSAKMEAVNVGQF